MILLAKLKATLDPQFIAKVERSLSVPQSCSRFLKGHFLSTLILNYLYDVVTKTILWDVGYQKSEYTFYKLCNHIIIIND